MKKTKQGVRDLNSIPSKPKGKVLDPVPEAADANSKTFAPSEHEQFWHIRGRGDGGFS